MTAKKYLMQLKKRILATEPLGAMMSGSGSTIFAIYDSRDEAQKAYRLFKSPQMFAVVTDLNVVPRFFSE